MPLIYELSNIGLIFLSFVLLTFSWDLEFFIFLFACFFMYLSFIHPKIIPKDYKSVKQPRYLSISSSHSLLRKPVWTGASPGLLQQWTSWLSVIPFLIVLGILYAEYFCLSSISCHCPPTHPPMLPGASSEMVDRRDSFWDFVYLKVSLSS